MVRDRRVVIVGGGVTGLSAAHAALSRAAHVGAKLEVVVLEGAARFGGNVVTERVDGFLLDGGPDSWVSSKPHATALARDLGLEGALMGTNEATRRYYVVWGGRLHAVPEGLVLGVPTRIAPLARTRLFSWRGKLRMAIEPLVRARRFDREDDDESVADFARRRLGREAADRLVAPLLGGVSAADASDVSIRAAFPQLVAMERDYGSLVRGMRTAARARERRGGGAAAGASAFVSLEGGVGQLVSALVERLRAEGATLRARAPVCAVARDEGGGYVVELHSGERLRADTVLLAVPAHAAAPIAERLDAALADRLRAIPHTSTATVFLAYRRSDVEHPLDGVGFVVPRALGRPLLAATWISSKWRGRCPEGHVLIRAFFGGAGGESVLARDDAQLSALAREELGALMGRAAEPLFSRVFRFEAARVQMRVGHLSAMRALREHLARVAPGVRMAGDGYDGAGIPDCIRQGQDAGRGLAADAGAIGPDASDRAAG